VTDVPGGPNNPEINTVTVLLNSRNWNLTATTMTGPDFAMAMARSLTGSLRTTLIGIALPSQPAPAGSDIAARELVVADLVQEGKLDSGLHLQGVTAWSGIDGPRPWFKKIVHKGRPGPIGRSGPGLAQPSFRSWARSRARHWDHSSTGLARRAFGTNQAEE
jgi:hypothetical protein